MTQYLVDTNHLSPLVTVHHPLWALFLTSIDNGDSFFLTTPVLTETLFGIGIIPRAKQNQAEWRQWHKKFFVIAPIEEDAIDAAEIQIDAQRRGWTLTTIDCITAAVAVRYNYVILTTDGDFRGIPSVKTENWLLT